MAVTVAQSRPELADALVELFATESRREPPDGPVLDAILLMVNAALEAIGIDAENGDPDAIARVATLRAGVLDLAQEEAFDTRALVSLAGAFSAARLDLGDALHHHLAARLDAAGPEASVPGGPEALIGHLTELAAEAGDVFIYAAQLRDLIAAVPSAQRGPFAVATFAPDVEILREAVLAWLFESAADTRAAVVALLGDAVRSGQVSGTMLRRLIMARTWLPEGERPAVDAVIAAARSRGVSVEPLAPAKVQTVYATGVDGAGAQSLFILVREGRRYAVAAILVKAEHGIRDAWVQHGGTRRDAESLLAQVAEQVGLLPSGIGYAETVMAHALAVNAASGELPPFGLLDVVESAGIATLRPQDADIPALVDSLCAALPTRWLGPEGDAPLLASSGSWPNIYPFVSSWFEDDPAVAAALTGRTRITAKAVSDVLDRVFEVRRARWAERMAWIALAMKEAPGGVDWAAFAVTARALLAGRPLRDIPIMTAIARLSAEVAIRRGRERARP